jgi:D-3-phosphoglycerate dehydrogenase
MKPTIYIASRSFGLFSQEALELVKSIAKIERNPYGRTMNEKELLRIIGEIDGIVVGTDKITRQIIESGSNLKIIAKHGVGLDNIDLKAATENDVVVTYVPHANAESVADLTIGLILSIARRIPMAHFSTKQGKWEAPKFLGTEVYGKTLGIIGLGEIGYRVAKRAMGFNMRILAYDPYVSQERANEVSARLVDIETVLKEADFVTLHAQLTDKTRGMIGKRELSLMKKTAYLINTARGALVDEKALYEALKNKEIAGAALDVYSEEPPSEGFPFFKLDNIIVTPHIAAYTIEAMIRMDYTVAEDIARFFRGEKPLYIANPEVLQKIKLK